MKQIELRRSLDIVQVAGGLSAISMIPLLVFTECPNYQAVISLSLVLLILPVIVAPFIRGNHRLEINVNAKVARFLMYIWAAASFAGLSLAVYWSGGVRNSPLIWSYELSIITALILNAFNNPTELTWTSKPWVKILNQNRIVIISTVFCILGVITISRCDIDEVDVISSPDLYYVAMACYTLLASIVLFYLSIENWKPIKENNDEKN